MAPEQPGGHGKGLAQKGPSSILPFSCPCSLQNSQGIQGSSDGTWTDRIRSSVTRAVLQVLGNDRLEQMRALGTQVKLSPGPIFGGC